LGSTIKLIESGRISRDESIVVCVTGNGLKTQEALQGKINQPTIINARLQEFDDLVKAGGKEYALKG
ncbi:MAG: threonine synthase, partial [Deltaproteobacteria bacterium]|nr:threonine synthase [Deltaproteobacteria bacterium]